MINTELKQSQITAQKQILTSEMRQQLEILSMNEASLREKVNKALEENPFLERTEEDFSRFGSVKSSGGSDGFIAEAVHGESLKESLKNQLYGLNLEKKKEKICLFMIESIDEKGYLNIKSDLGRAIGVKIEEINECAEIIRGFEPVGVGAENLTQCLILQLKAKNKLNPVTEFMVKEGLELLAGEKYDKIAKKVKCSEKEAEKWAEEIKSLNPVPARGFDSGENVKYIVPDALIEVKDGALRIVMNESQRVRFSHEYDSVRDLNSVLKEKKSEAKALERAVASRYDTLEEIITVICAKQMEYFIGKDGLKPLLMKDIADKTGLSISTVSRGIKDKYIMYEGKTMPLKALFTQKAPGGADISVNSVKSEISRIIANENGEKPFSDEEIREILSDYGIEISRRTVAKYREDSQIPNAYTRLRKFRKNSGMAI